MSIKMKLSHFKYAYDLYIAIFNNFCAHYMRLHCMFTIEHFGILARFFCLCRCSPIFRRLLVVCYIIAQISVQIYRPSILNV